MNKEFNFDINDIVQVDGLRDYRTIIEAIYLDKLGVRYNVKWTNSQGDVQEHYYAEGDIHLM